VRVCLEGLILTYQEARRRSGQLSGALMREKAISKISSSAWLLGFSLLQPNAGQRLLGFVCAAYFTALQLMIMEFNRFNRSCIKDCSLLKAMRNEQACVDTFLHA